MTRNAMTRNAMTRNMMTRLAARRARRVRKTSGIRFGIALGMVLSCVTVLSVGSADMAAAKLGPASCNQMGGWQLPGQPVCLFQQSIAWRANGYTLRVENAESAHYEAFHDDAVTLAAQLTVETGIAFNVGDVVPVGQSPARGEIILRADTPLSECDGIACAGGYSSSSWPWIVKGDQIEGGQVWFRQDIHRMTPSVRLAVIRHEVGHVLGLMHYDLVGAQRTIDGEDVTSQVMQWNLRETTVRDFQPGDLAGLKYLADFQRRSPDATMKGIETVPGGFVVNGDGADPSAKSAPLTLRVSIDGGAATLSKFGTTNAASVGDHEVCITFVNVGAGVDVDGGCHDVTILLQAKATSVVTTTPPKRTTPSKRSTPPKRAIE